MENKIQDAEEKIKRLEAEIDQLEEMVKTLSRANSRMRDQLYAIEQIIKGNLECCSKMFGTEG